MNRFFLLLGLFSCIPLILFSQTPKYEVRAVWISTASGEWPKSTNVNEQQRSLIAMFDFLKENNFNTIYFQARPRGNTFYHSYIEPWAQQLTGVLGKDPGWDPLEFAVEEAHNRGMELHAWFNVAKVWGAGDMPTDPQHVVNKHRDWVQQVDGEWWIDMGNPDARAYTERVALELVKNYDIDGIQFDFIRYPAGMFNDKETFSRWGDGSDLVSWRRNNITAFVSDCYKEIEKEKPWCKVGSAPVGIYTPIDGASSGFSGYSSVAQDSRAWLREKVSDYLVPQIYWSIGEQNDPYDPDFEVLCGDWAGENYGRQVVAGMGIYRENVQPEVQDEVLIARRARLQGEAFFRFDNLQDIIGQLKGVYRSPALFPPMIWKDSIPPLAPANIAIQTNENGSIDIRWGDPQPAADGQIPFRYVVYRSIDSVVDTRKAENIMAVLPSSVHMFRGEQSPLNETKYYYTVTSLDRCGNESVPSTESVGETPTLFSRFMRPSLSPVLSPNYPEPFSTRTYVSYSLPYRSEVTFSVTSSITRKETVIVSGTKNPGLHVVTIDGASFPAGPIEYQLKTNGEVLRRVMEKK